jgi:Cu2+-exporting ATPase
VWALPVTYESCTRRPRTVRKMHQNLWWAVGYNSLALPIAAGAFEPLGFVLRPEVGAISMAGSSVIVALNAVALKRLRLPDQPRWRAAAGGRQARRPRTARPRDPHGVMSSGSLPRD